MTRLTCSRFTNKKPFPQSNTLHSPWQKRQQKKTVMLYYIILLYYLYIYKRQQCELKNGCSTPINSKDLNWDHHAVPQTPLGPPSSWMHTFEFLHPHHLCSCILQVCLFGWRPETLLRSSHWDTWDVLGVPIFGNVMINQWIFRDPLLAKGQMNGDGYPGYRWSTMDPQMAGHVEYSTYSTYSTFYNPIIYNTIYYYYIICMYNII